VRRAKLYYLRDRVGRASRVRERRWTGAEEVIEPGLVEAGAMPADDAPRPGEEELGDQVAAEETVAETDDAVAAPDEAAAAPDEAAAEADVPADSEAKGDEPADTPDVEAEPGDDQAS
jgi:large subunit ribosomal protein L19